jgi:hypothetical protein
MLIERPTHEELTDADLQNLIKLKSVIDSAIADGTVSKEDMEAINCAIHSDGKVSIEEIALIRQLVRDKLDSGLLTYEY